MQVTDKSTLANFSKIKARLKQIGLEDLWAQILFNDGSFVTYSTHKDILADLIEEKTNFKLWEEFYSNKNLEDGFNTYQIGLSPLFSMTREHGECRLIFIGLSETSYKESQEAQGNSKK